MHLVNIYIKAFTLSQDTLKVSWKVRKKIIITNLYDITSNSIKYSIFDFRQI